MATLPKLDSTKDLNRRAILELIRERDDISRRDLVGAAGLILHELMSPTPLPIAPASLTEKVNFLTPVEI